jgi:N-acetylmuramoyl-L-alanine amidase
MKKNLLAALLILILPLTISAMSLSEETSGHRNSIVTTIVIDPGHGGPDDPGAVGPSGLTEKELTLAIAKYLEAMIISDPDLSAAGVRVVLTRDSDRPLQLEERAAIANNANGDLFISIHANGHQVRSAHGAETFFLSLKASDDHARAVAEIENQALEDADQNGENSLNGDDGLKLILFDFIHKQYIAESKFLAEHIQEEFNASINNGSRGVRQAPFRVLKGVAMPAVLVEVDFITNPAREQLLRSEEYRERFARSLLTSIKQYKTRKERGYTVDAETAP